MDIIVEEFGEALLAIIASIPVVGMVIGVLSIVTSF